MAKSLRTIIPNQSGYTPKAGDEKKFAALHKTQVVDLSDDKHGPEETQFKADNVKTFDRSANHYGNNPGEDADSEFTPSRDDYDEDEVVGEEKIDEVSTKILKSYVKKASKDIWVQGDQASRGNKAGLRKVNNRITGVTKAIDKVDMKTTKEEEQLDEAPTRKNFREVANTVRAIENPKKRQEFSDHHASIYSKQNPRFDHAKWHAACGTVAPSMGKKKKDSGEQQLDNYARYKKDRIKEEEQIEESVQGFKGKDGKDYIRKDGKVIPMPSREKVLGLPEKEPKKTLGKKLRDIFHKEEAGPLVSEFCFTESAQPPLYRVHSNPEETQFTVWKCEDFSKGFDKVTAEFENVYDAEEYIRKSALEDHKVMTNV